MPRRMPIRLRKFLGAVLLLILVTVWALIAMAIAQFPAIFNSPWIAGVYYCLAGIGWVIPAMPIVTWMSRPDPAPDVTSR